MSLLSIWVFTMLVLVWVAVFLAAPTIGATIWSFHLGVPGRIALGAFAVLIYLPALMVFALWLAALWDQTAGWPPA